MKTAVIISDTHGNFRAIDKLLPIMMENDHVFHLGDCEKDIWQYRKELNNKILSVSGNCDGGGSEEFVEIEGVKILLTHGNKYGVKESLYKLSLRAKELGVSTVFYGHTHLSDIKVVDGVSFVNPGSLSNFGVKSYCYAVFHQGKVVCKIVDVD